MLIWKYSATFTPFAARTQQYVKEQLGQVEDKVRKLVITSGAMAAYHFADPVTS